MGLSPRERLLRWLGSAARFAAWEAAAGERLGQLAPPAQERVRAALDQSLAALEAGQARRPALPGGDDVALRWAHEGCWLSAEPEEAGVGSYLDPDPGRLPAALEGELRARLLPSADAGLAALREGVELLASAWELAQEPLAARLERARQALARHEASPAVARRALLLSLDRVPERLRAAARERAEQRERWAELGLDSAPQLFSAEAGGLPVDTRLHPEGWVEDLRGALEGAPREGVLVVGDNARGLRWLRARYAGQVQCAYLDPPFNTQSRAFAYRDARPRADWLCFMDERLALSGELLRPDGTLYAHIDQHEKERLRLLLDRHLHYVAEVIWRIGWVSGFKTRAKKFIRNHDTIYQYGKSKKPFFSKRYLPYPEGYVRRDGKPPTGKGIPLEDTWNCSAADRLDSIQIMSFSREKVGRGDLTQKNENLLARMLEASSRPGDWVLDPFLGSGTTAASALKLGRRWLGCERSPELVEEVIVPRLQRVLAGEPYGISRQTGWQGGGLVELHWLADPGAGPSGPPG